MFVHIVHWQLAKPKSQHSSRSTPTDMIATFRYHQQEKLENRNDYDGLWSSFICFQGCHHRDFSCPDD